MRGWLQCNYRHRCRICDADHRCSYTTDGNVSKCCNVYDAPGATGRGSDHVGDFALYFAEGQRAAGYTPPAPDPVPPVATVADRHRAYTALLSVLSLSTDHRHALLRRGLTPADVERNGYKTLPPMGDRHAVVKALRHALGGTITNDVPGLLHNGDTVKLLGAPGLLIPVRDALGQIVALKVRADAADDDGRGAKYLWISSNRDDKPGASAGAPCHVTLLTARDPSVPSDPPPSITVRLTEGPLKADVAAAFSGVTTLGIGGATAWRSCIEHLRTLGATVVRLAWDADASKPPKHVEGRPRYPNAVAGGLEAAALGLTDEGFTVELETWSTVDFEPKGIDDALAAGADVTVHRGGAVWRELVAILRAAEREPRAETLARVAKTSGGGGDDGGSNGSSGAPATVDLLADLPARTKTDPGAPLAAGVPTAAAKLKTSDPAAFARLCAGLKSSGGAMSLFNAAVRDAEKTLRRESAPKPTGRMFARGDAVELGAAMLADLQGDGAESIVFDRGQFWRYDPATGIYAIVSGQETYRIVSTYAGCFAGVGERVKPIKLSHNEINGAIKAAAQFASHPGFFDRARDGLAFANGFVTVTAVGEVLILPLSPEHRATHALPVAYEPTRPRARWLAMLEQVFRRTAADLSDDVTATDDGLGANAEAVQKHLSLDTQGCIDLLQEFAGAAVLGFATSYATCLVLVGPGNDGKSKTLSVLRALFPGNAVCSVPPQNWSRGFLLAELSGKRLNVVSELPEREIQESQRFKAVVAGDPLTAERKYADPFDLICGAGHLFACNALPATRDQTVGFWRRFAVIPCTRQFSGAEEIRDYDRIVIAEEIAGVAAWAIGGAARLRKQGHYTAPGSSTKAKAEWQLDSDQVRQFVEDCCEKHPTDPTTFKQDAGVDGIDDLYDAFVVWCRRSGHTGMNRNRLGNRLRALGYDGRTKLARLFKLRLRLRPVVTTSAPVPSRHEPPPRDDPPPFDDSLEFVEPFH